MTHMVRILSAGLIAAALAAGCGGGPAPGSIRLGWRLGFGVACNDAAANVDQIRVRVLAPQGAKEVQAPQVFGCTSNSGVIPAIAPGTYNLKVEAFRSNAPTVNVFEGTVGGVVVKSNQQVDVGTVIMERVPDTVNPEGLRITWSFGGPLCGAAGVANVRIQVWRELVYKQHDQTYPCETGFVVLQVPPGTYGVIGEGIDATGRIVRSARKGDVVVQDADVNVDLVLTAN